MTITESSSIYLIVGLGNPGREYKDNRHNMGFMVLDYLAVRLGTNFGRLQSHALIAKGEYQERRILLAKPQTYMNLSGQAVSSLARFYQVPLETMLVVYDDVDLPLGILRLRPDGGSAGQKGMRSIIERLGTEVIPRLRIGIGRPPGRMDAAAYVLQDFSRAEAELLPQILDRACEAALTFITRGLETAMNQYNPALDHGN